MRHIYNKIPGSKMLTLNKNYSSIIILIVLLNIFSMKMAAQTENMRNGTVTLSGNVTFFDSGGPTLNYSNNENLTITFVPSNPGEYVEVDFTSFSVQPSSNDYLEIFDGLTTGATFLGRYSGTLGNFAGIIGTSGTNTPVGSPIRASNPDGALTFRFVSNNNTTQAGWEADVRVSTTPGLQYIAVDNGVFYVSDTDNFLFVDNGGINGFSTVATASYSRVTCFCPTEPGSYVNVNFSQFDVDQDHRSYVQVFDGPSVLSTFTGIYTSTFNPGNITSSDPSGCLTFRFFAIAFYTSNGWLATVNTVPNPGEKIIAMTDGNRTITESYRFTDSGGINGNCLMGNYHYPFQATYTQVYTMCPQTNNEAISVSFTSFNLNNWGTLTLNIFNGDDVSAPLLRTYTWSSNPIPDINVANNPTGCLTFSFVGQQWNYGPGWDANITLVFNQAALPVSLISFDGKEVDGKVLLSWETATEVDNSHFIIEHSTDGKAFSNVGRVKGNNTTIVNSKYSFSHSEPRSGENYYKLVQYDYNGDSQSYGPISVEVKVPDYQVSNLFPNPVASSVGFSANLMGPDVISCSIYDAFGSLHSTREFSLDKGFHKVEIECNNLFPGVYFLSVKDSRGNSRVQYFIKQ